MAPLDCGRLERLLRWLRRSYHGEARKQLRRPARQRESNARLIRASSSSGEGRGSVLVGRRSPYGGFGGPPGGPAESVHQFASLDVVPRHGAADNLASAQPPLPLPPPPPLPPSPSRSRPPPSPPLPTLSSCCRVAADGRVRRSSSRSPPLRRSEAVGAATDGGVGMGDGRRTSARARAARCWRQSRAVRQFHLKPLVFTIILHSTKERAFTDSHHPNLPRRKPFKTMRRCH